MIPTLNTVITIRKLKRFAQSQKTLDISIPDSYILVTTIYTKIRSHILPVHVFWMHLLGSNAWLCNVLFDNLDKQLELYEKLVLISMNAIWCYSGYYHYHRLLRIKDCAVV